MVLGRKYWDASIPNHRAYWDLQARGMGIDEPVKIEGRFLENAILN